MFEVGKKAVCKIHMPAAGLKKGNVVPVRGISASRCGCDIILLDVGCKTLGRTVICPRCNKQEDGTEIYWLNSNGFAPLTDETIGDTTIEELLSETTYYELEQQNLNHSAYIPETRWTG